MNENTSMPTLTGQNTLQEAILNNIHQIISDAVTEAESVSKGKYEVKLKLIESSPDMSTQEKLDAMDKNYDRWNQEYWQNMFTFTLLLFGLAIGSPIAVKTIRKLVAA